MISFSCWGALPWYTKAPVTFQAGSWGSGDAHQLSALGNPPAGQPGRVVAELPVSSRWEPACTAACLYFCLLNPKTTCLHSWKPALLRLQGAGNTGREKSTKLVFWMEMHMKNRVNNNTNSLLFFFFFLLLYAFVPQLKWKLQMILTVITGTAKRFGAGCKSHIPSPGPVP